jgi:hypothetical protein
MPRRYVLVGSDTRDEWKSMRVTSPTAAGWPRPDDTKGVKVAEPERPGDAQTRRDSITNGMVRRA